MAPMKKSIIDHTYRDYSQTELSDLIDDSDRKNKDDLFPAKLHRILATPEYANIIAWKPHGRAWAVINKPVFVNQILPRHFQHSNYESFNRSVNGWGMKVSLIVLLLVGREGSNCFIIIEILYIYCNVHTPSNAYINAYMSTHCNCNKNSGCIKMVPIKRLTIMKCFFEESLNFVLQCLG